MLIVLVIVNYRLLVVGVFCCFCCIFVCFVVLSVVCDIEM